jgi:hypothetical protein
MYFSKQTTRILTLILVVASLFLSAVGGLSDILDKPIYISRQHAFADASLLLLIAILLNVMI